MIIIIIVSCTVTRCMGYISKFLIWYYNNDMALLEGTWAICYIEKGLDSVVKVIKQCIIIEVRRILSI